MSIREYISGMNRDVSTIHTIRLVHQRIEGKFTSRRRACSKTSGSEFFPGIQLPETDRNRTLNTVLQSDNDPYDNNESDGDMDPPTDSAALP